MAALYHMLQAPAAVTSFRVKVSTAADAPGSTEVIDTVNPDRTHEVTTVGGKITQEIIGIAGTTYSTSGDDAWQKLPVSAATQALIASAKPDLPSIDSFPKFISTAQAVSPEDLAGIPTLVYPFAITRTTPVKAGTFVSTLENKRWVAVADGLVRKLVADSTTQAQGRTITSPPVTMVYYDYNADINIAAPIQ